MSHPRNMFISLLILLSGDSQSNLDLFLMTLLSICALLTSGRSVIFYTILLLLTWLILITLMSLLLKKLGFLLTVPLLFGFTFINTPRLVRNSCTCSIVGGGTAFLLREPCELLSTPILILSNPLNCPHSRSNFPTLISLYITSIALLD